MNYTNKKLSVGIVGCGFVAGMYMITAKNYTNFKIVGVTDLIEERAARFAAYYKIRLYKSAVELIESKEIDVILNLTNPHSHYEISKLALLNGKHVYCEKPMAMELEQARELVKLAVQNNVILSNAPCSLHGNTAQTIWKTIKDGKIGNVKLVYAEMDDGPIHLMNPENWKSKLGTPWPYEEEFKTGCTIEHIGYCLTWLLAFFGPAVKVTAFSHALMKQKMPDVEPCDTPDFSVACIEHQSGVISRITCGILAPVDRSLTIIGERGHLKIHDFWNNNGKVMVKYYSSFKIKAERKEWVMKNPVLRWVFNTNYSTLPLIRIRPKPFRLVNQKITMDYLLGVSDLVDAVVSGAKPLLSAEFSLHVTELSLKIQNSFKEGGSMDIETTF